MKQRAHLIWGLIGGAIAALGTIKTLVELSSDQKFSLQKTAFYVGAAAMITHFGVVAAIAVGGVFALIISLLGGEDWLDRNRWPILVIAGAAGLLFAGVLLSSDWLVYEQIDSFGRGAIALLGLAAIAVTITCFAGGRHRSPQRSKQGFRRI